MLTDARLADIRAAVGNGWQFPAHGPLWAMAGELVAEVDRLRTELAARTAEGERLREALESFANDNNRLRAAVGAMAEFTALQAQATSVAPPTTPDAG